MKLIYFAFLSLSLTAFGQSWTENEMKQACPIVFANLSMIICARNHIQAIISNEYNCQEDALANPPLNQKLYDIKNSVFSVCGLLNCHLTVGKCDPSDSACAQQKQKSEEECKINLKNWLSCLIGAGTAFTSRYCES